MLVTPSIRFRLRLASPGSQKAREVSAASFMRVTAGAVRKAREVTALFQEGWTCSVQPSRALFQSCGDDSGDDSLISIMLRVPVRPLTLPGQVVTP